jgi:hypothetical protein
MTDWPPAETLTETALAAFRASYNLSSAHALSADPVARVRRLDADSSYVIVPVRDRLGLSGFVGLDARTGGVNTIAKIRDPSSTFLAPAPAAVAAASRALPDVADWGEPFLGWQPCRESPDSLRPLWVVPHAAGSVFVTQSLQVFERLSQGRGG